MHGQSEKPEELVETFKDVTSEENIEGVMNIAKQFIEKGIQQGMLAGMLEGERKGRYEGMLEGERRGMLEGERKGRYEGMLEGERKGKYEGRSEATEFFVRNMYSDGQDVATIAKFTNLTVSEVLAIVKKLAATSGAVE